MSDIGNNNSGFNLPSLPNRKLTSEAKVSNSKKSPEKTEKLQAKEAQENFQANIVEIQNKVTKERESVDSFAKQGLHQPSPSQAQTVSSSIAQIFKSQEKKELEKEDQEEKEVQNLLEEIVCRSGEKGQQFAAFVKRELQKGKLSDSIKELVYGFHQNLKGDSLKASEQLKSGNEVMSLVKDMVGSKNTKEQQAIQKAFANLPTTSLSLKADLLVIRTINKNDKKLSAPKFQNKEESDSKTEAANFIVSINCATAPWDRAALAL